MNKIYKTILNRKLENFVSLFTDDSNSIFKNPENRLIHPAEYGKYREESCREILKLLLKKKYKVSDGFVFTCDDKISTQCDVIIYNSDLSPLISNDIANMFPVEEVRMIGEIKSNLSKENFKSALVKLAKNKALYKQRKGNPNRKKYSNECFNSIGTFLICNKLEFDYSKINLKDIYGDIPREEWHNAILSIEDGFISYDLDFKGCSPENIQLLKSNSYNIDVVGCWAYPYYILNNEYIETKDGIDKANPQNPYSHIIRFFVNMVKCSDEVWSYEYDPVTYLGLNKEPFFIK